MQRSAHDAPIKMLIDSFPSGKRDRDVSVCLSTEQIDPYQQRTRLVGIIALITLTTCYDDKTQGNKDRN